MRGRRVAITTTIDRGRQLADIVSARGCQPVLLPCIEVTPFDDEILASARSSARRADWLVVTSPRTIATLWPDGGMPNVRVTAVGKRTARAVERAGGDVEIVGADGAGVLMERLLERVYGEVFFPHGAVSDPAAADRLREVGANVTTLAVYDTRSIPPGPEPVEVALFGSPSAVTGWSLSRGFCDVTLAAIGSTTADALTALGHAPQLVAPNPDYTTLIDQVASHLSMSGASLK